MKTVPTLTTDYGKLDNQYVGLSTIPRQFSKHSAEVGFVLNVLVVRRRGLGSSTLINSLFGAPLVAKDRPDDLTTVLNEVVEDGVRLKVSVTTYHGEDYGAVEKFMEQKNKEYYENEQGLSSRHDDRRVHVCLHVLPAHRMSPNEIKGMGLVSRLCNLIPVITKADMFTEHELRARKEGVHGMLFENEISVFRYDLGINTNAAGVPGVVDSQGEFTESQYAMCVDNPGEATVSNEKMHVLATVASEKTYNFQGKIIRGRKYGWGFIDITNEQHSDFLKLQRILITAHYEDLIWETETVFYNAYRNAISSRDRCSDDADAQELLRIRLGRLQAQMEEILEKKHRAAMESLKREEVEISSPSQSTAAVKVPGNIEEAQ